MKCDICHRNIEGTVRVKTMHGWMQFCPECKIGWENRYVKTITFPDVIQRIEQASHGTLVIICGKVGCGKSTLALKLLREFNGYDDPDMIMNVSDAVPGNPRFGSIPKGGRAIQLEIYLSSAKDSRAAVDDMLGKGRIVIVTVPDIHWIPKDYTTTDGNKAKCVCILTFKDDQPDRDKRGFAVKGFAWETAFNDYIQFESHGYVTREEANELHTIYEKLAYKWMKNIKGLDRGDGYLPDHDGTDYFTCPKCGCGEFDSFPQTVPADRSVRWTYEYQCSRCKTIIGLTLRGNDRGEKE